MKSHFEMMDEIVKAIEEALGLHIDTGSNFNPANPEATVRQTQTDKTRLRKIYKTQLGKIGIDKFIALSDDPKEMRKKLFHSKNPIPPMDL